MTYSQELNLLKQTCFTSLRWQLLTLWLLEMAIFTINKYSINLLALLKFVNGMRQPYHHYHRWYVKAENRIMTQKTIAIVMFCSIVTIVLNGFCFSYLWFSNIWLQVYVNIKNNLGNITNMNWLLEKRQLIRCGNVYMKVMFASGGSRIFERGGAWQW